MQHGAARAVALSDYRGCGYAPKAYWQELRNQFGDRVMSVVIDAASHALFPEQPERVAGVLLPWLAGHRDVPGPSK